MELAISPKGLCSVYYPHRILQWVRAVSLHLQQTHYHITIKDQILPHVEISINLILIIREAQNKISCML